MGWLICLQWMPITANIYTINYNKVQARFVLETFYSKFSPLRAFSRPARLAWLIPALFSLSLSLSLSLSCQRCKILYLQFEDVPVMEFMYLKFACMSG